MAQARPPSRPAAADREQRLFRRRRLARRLGVWRLVALAVLALGLVVLGVYALWFSSWLAVDDVEVEGTDLLSASHVEQAAGVGTGGALVSVDTDAVERRVEALAAVASADVVRRWPHTLLVSVTEREPVAAVTIGSAVRALDGDGVVFPAPAGVTDPLPAVRTSGTVTATALREAAGVVVSLPDDLAEQVRYVEVRSADEVVLAMTRGRTVVWGSSSDSATKAEVLAVLLEQDASVYDVSVPGTPTTSD
ncbi:cell division protein FtsQ/DivIB [Nocardioides bruguierae]|uniref:FtsQ-type POTRA domain-containing protein n=1 Tax=Nocardioides bruguierae TaxID=2945102 RepID=A0A9X2DBN5_9ACTN|nr:FtsQ-type POTRA domain-containing protein [Nocardioides bruguierae]MCL8026987.1 FtsQ-type POTRA domain-containing protein [Nocardioides bruguierae]MCM0621614.1 FtsQ-type POTRA domain-containing protein [Nocardioides bruguierae]